MMFQKGMNIYGNLPFDLIKNQVSNFKTKCFVFFSAIMNVSDTLNTTEASTDHRMFFCCCDEEKEEK